MPRPETGDRRSVLRVTRTTLAGSTTLEQDRCVALIGIGAAHLGPQLRERIDGLISASLASLVSKAALRVASLRYLSHTLMLPPALHCDAADPICPSIAKLNSEWSGGDVPISE
jgi:hypothetical protein